MSHKAITFDETLNLMLKQTPKTTASRYQNQRIAYDEALVYEILDEALFCTVSYSENNEPFSIPQSFARVGDKIILHASVGSHFMRKLADGRSVCLSFMLADDLVIAKSAFHHSVNYRSVVMFSKGEIVEDYDLKYLAFKELTNKIVPNSWDYLRPINQKEIDKTLAISFQIVEANSKVRQGQPSHEEEENDLPIWTGLIPIKPLRGKPIGDDISKDIPLPAHLQY
ncbi:hypothetical protein SAMN06298216_3249 [Spirosomataceae bacterium TFI 002]|nr:hypothetical protein SAMN06298216_3249 [Spirosomataceae bacterium TFI 002]